MLLKTALVRKAVAGINLTKRAYRAGGPTCCRCESWAGHRCPRWGTCCCPQFLGRWRNWVDEARGILHRLERDERRASIRRERALAEL